MSAFGGSVRTFGSVHIHGTGAHGGRRPTSRTHRLARPDEPDELDARRVSHADVDTSRTKKKKQTTTPLFSRRVTVFVLKKTTDGRSKKKKTKKKEEGMDRSV